MKAQCFLFGLNAQLHKKRTVDHHSIYSSFFRLDHHETDRDKMALLNSSFSDLASEQ